MLPARIVTRSIALPFVKRSLAAALLALLPFPAEAASNPEAWTTLSASGEIASDLELDLELVGRFGDEQGGLYEVDAGILLGYKLSDDLTIAAGYAFLPNYDDGDLTSREHRIRQQVTAGVGKLLGGDFELRARLEQRLRDDGDDMGLRLRTRIAWTRPIREGAETAFRLTHESFVELNDTDWGQDAGYRRMRNFAGLRTPLSDSLQAEIGYLNQYDIESGAEDEIAHVLSVSLNVDF